MRSNSTDWIMNSGASKHFTHVLSDFSNIEYFDGPELTTTAQKASLKVKGVGTVFLTHFIKHKDGSSRRVTTLLHPVYYVPGMSTRLLSMGKLLLNGYSIIGDANIMKFYEKNCRSPSLSVEPHAPGQTIFWLNATVTSSQSLVSYSTIDSENYDLWHKR